MKRDLERYKEHQIYLLKDGSFIYVVDVDPVTKMNKEENSRSCFCKVGHKYTKGENFKVKGKYLCIVENGPMDQVISIDMSKSRQISISELRKKEAIYVGEVVGDKLKEINRTISEFANDSSSY